MKDRVDNFLEWAMAFLLGIMVLDVFWGVITRYLLESQSSWTDELARFLLVWLSIMGAAYASGKNCILPLIFSRKALTKNSKTTWTCLYT